MTKHKGPDYKLSAGRSYDLIWHGRVSSIFGVSCILLSSLGFIQNFNAIKLL